MDDNFGHWLAGFIDGEGCFEVTVGGRAGHRLPWCRFQLCVRDDDAPVVYEIQHDTGIGRVRRDPKRSELRANPQVVWDVSGAADCVALVALLDRFPLRAKKARDLTIWRCAVAEQAAHQQGAGVPRSGGQAHIDRMLVLKDALVAVKAYAKRTSFESSQPPLELVS